MGEVPWYWTISQLGLAHRTFALWIFATCSLMYPRNQPILSVYILRFFLTCQVRVVRCYVSCPTSLLVLLLLLLGSATLNCKLVIAVVPAGPEQQALDQSEPRRTSTASAWSQRSPPQPQRSQRIVENIPDTMPERMSEDMSGTYARKNVRRYVRYICQKECQIECQSICQIECQILPDRMSE